ncbi:MAG TPA: hypothetical protein VII09_11475 [Opitutaceae bacterium]
MTNEETVAFLRKNLISVSCAVISIAIGFVLYYRVDLLPEAEKVLGERAKQGELLAANIEDSAQLAEQHAALVKANNAIADRMIHVGQLAENLQYFYRLESDTGVKLLDPRQTPWSPPAKTAARTNFTSVGFTLTAQGDYPQLVDLLRKLENGEHYCRVIACNFRPASEFRGGQLQMRLSIDLMGIQ